MYILYIYRICKSQSEFSAMSKQGQIKSHTHKWNPVTSHRICDSHLFKFHYLSLNAKTKPVSLFTSTSTIWCQVEPTNGMFADLFFSRIAAYLAVSHSSWLKNQYINKVVCKSFCTTPNCIFYEVKRKHKLSSKPF